MRGDPHASSGRIVVPSVVRANQAIVLNAAAGKPRAAVETKILPRAKAFIAPPEHDVLPEESRRPDFSCPHAGGLGNNVPIVK